MAYSLSWTKSDSLSDNVGLCHARSDLAENLDEVVILRGGHKRVL